MSELFSFYQTLLYCAEGNMHLLMDRGFVRVTGQDVNTNRVFFG